MIHLKGIAWDHPRGFDPMVETAKIYKKKNPVGRPPRKNSLLSKTSTNETIDIIAPTVAVTRLNEL